MNSRLDDDVRLSPACDIAVRVDMRVGRRTFARQPSCACRHRALSGFTSLTN
jgi:hypothetical protein